MQARRRILIAVALLYAVGLVWGYFRLPLAAIKNLHDYRIFIAQARAVSLDEIDISAPQLGYLRGAIPLSRDPVVPRLSVAVSWNALVVARINSGYYHSNEGAERMDILYICLFGAWVPIHTYS